MQQINMEKRFIVSLIETLNAEQSLITSGMRARATGTRLRSSKVDHCQAIFNANDAIASNVRMKSGCSQRSVVSGQLPTRNERVS
jgi:hypothetical protein